MRLARLLAGCEQVALDPAAARRCGELLGRSGSSDVVDAVVVDEAGRRGRMVVTSDPDDLGRLASARGTAIAIVKV